MKQKSARKKRIRNISGAGAKLRLRKTQVNVERTDCFFGRSAKKVGEFSE
jgi:hypothetical protein